MQRSVATKIALFCGGALVLCSLVETLRADDTENSSSAEKLKVTFSSPVDGESIPRVYDNLRGTIQGDIPEKHQLYCFIKDKYNYFVQSPQPSVAAGRFKQMNVRCSTKGSWELHLVLANPEAIVVIEGRIKDGIFAGMKELPEGAVTLNFVDVEVK